MNKFLLILHFFGLGIGSAGLLGGFVVQLVIDARPPEDAPVLVRVLPRFARASQIGLALLLVTGLLLLWLKWYGGTPNPTMFIVKMVLVVALIAMVIVLAIDGRKAIRDHDMAAAGRLPLYRRIATTILMLVITFAVLTFN
jgi:uncharacterized membrane protein